jgi:predicted AAA+ superfamily ATPase
MITRTAERTLRVLAREFKALALIGPRQSGKTTLARQVFSDKPYVSLEDPDQRRFAQQDARRFLGQFPKGAILDEVQRVPTIFSYLQGILDSSSRKGLFVLTGSCHFGLMEHITQSLAGRIGLLHLLPFSLDELSGTRMFPASVDHLLFAGLYPPIHDQKVAPERWYSAYVATYLERDVRQLFNIRDFGAFERFLALCAGCVGQQVNTVRIGSDCGISHNTVRAWLDVLQASYLAILLRPHHRNFRKRVVKMPKLYFIDTGLAARLLGIESHGQLNTHPLRGALFENWVVMEMLKARLNRGQSSNLYFWRNNTGLEVDVLAEHADKLMPVEIKSGGTVVDDWFNGLRRWRELAGTTASRGWLIYGGDATQEREDATVLPWKDIGRLINSV